MKRIPLNTGTLGDEETKAVLEVLRSNRATMGGNREFEAAFGGYLIGAEAIFVNFGSSANLLGFFALANKAAWYHHLSYIQNHRRTGGG